MKEKPTSRPTPRLGWEPTRVAGEDITGREKEGDQGEEKPGLSHLRGILT
jgi:hypothetical protein